MQPNPHDQRPQVINIHEFTNDNGSQRKPQGNGNGLPQNELRSGSVKERFQS